MFIDFGTMMENIALQENNKEKYPEYPIPEL